MKIIFICGSLEPGKDGVGDYTRKLACTLLKEGNKASIIAFNDKFIKEDFSEEYQYDEGVELPVKRFSQNLTWEERTTKANDYLNQFKPDWISLQYVPYGFNKKGLPFYLPQTFERLHTKARWHIMFHETWIGISNSAPFMHKVYGYFQKKIIATLLRRLKPRLVTTTNVVYQLTLKEKKITAACLPLFSNIAVCEQDENYISVLEKKHAVDLCSGEYFKIGIFGTLYPEANLPEIVPAFTEKKTGSKVLVVVFGKNSRPEELDKLKQNLPDGVTCIELGELSACQTSHIFKILDEAVLCTPVEYIGKSGAYAALRLHDVKVTALSRTPITRYEKEIKQYNQYLAERETAKWGIAHIKNKFIALLNEHTL